MAVALVEQFAVDFIRNNGGAAAQGNFTQAFEFGALPQAADGVVGVAEYSAFTRLG